MYVGEQVSRVIFAAGVGGLGVPADSCHVLASAASAARRHSAQEQDRTDRELAPDSRREKVNTRHEADARARDQWALSPYASLVASSKPGRNFSDDQNAKLWVA